VFHQPVHFNGKAFADKSIALADDLPAQKDYRDKTIAE